MGDLVRLLEETDFPFAYDYFAEGQSPNLQFICYLLSQRDNFSSDGMVYMKVNSVNIELYTDSKDLSTKQKLEAVMDTHGIFMKKQKYGLRVKNSMKSSAHLK